MQGVVGSPALSLFAEELWHDQRGTGTTSRLVDRKTRWEIEKARPVRAARQNTVRRGLARLSDVCTNASFEFSESSNSRCPGKHVHQNDTPTEICGLMDGGT